MEHLSDRFNKIKADMDDLNEKMMKVKAINVTIYEEGIFENNLEKLNEYSNQNEIKYYRPLESHIKGIGLFVVFVKKMIRKSIKFLIEPIVNEINEINSNNQIKERLIIETLEETLRKINAEREQREQLIFELGMQVAEISKRIDNEENMINQSNSINEYLRAELQLIEESFDDRLTAQANLIGDFKSTILSRIKNNEENLRGNNNRLLEYDSKMETLSKSVNLTRRSIRDLSKTNPVISKQTEPQDSQLENSHIESNSSFDYLLFEEKFRGKEEVIKERQSFYLKYFEDKERICDIGCGRGEFLSNFTDMENKKAIGIDLNADMVATCVEQGIDAIKADALVYLANRKNQFDAIFSAQVVEHLTNEQLMQLVKVSYEALDENGLLIIETINPMCLYTLGRSFTLDPTHVKYVNPYALEFILESEGFVDIKIEYLSKVNIDTPMLVLSDVDGSNVDEFNKNLARLTNEIYGYQDYAIFARK